jgi:hypothetical protein
MFGANDPWKRLTQVLADFDALAAHHDSVGRQSLDPELASFVVEKPPGALELNQALTALDDYDAASARWYGFLLGGEEGRRAKAGRPLRFPDDPEVSQRLRQFMESVKARVLCQDFLVRTFGIAPAGLLPDAELTRRLDAEPRMVARDPRGETGNPAGSRERSSPLPSAVHWLRRRRRSTDRPDAPGNSPSSRPR